MEQVIHIDYRPLDHVDRLIRDKKKENRLRALDLLDNLVQSYGKLDYVPEDDALLHEARMGLGAYDEDFAVTDVVALKARLNRLSDHLLVTQYSVMELLAEEMGLSAGTIKSKIYRNRFTILERRTVWQKVSTLENVCGLPSLSDLFVSY